MITVVEIMAAQTARTPETESLLLEVADVVNSTLDLDTTLKRVAEVIHRIINYEIFAILLLNEKTQELRIRFQIGHTNEVAEQIRQQSWGKEMVLIAQTGWGQQEDKQRAVEAGFDHHLTKPVDVTELLKLIAAVRPGREAARAFRTIR